ncbi:hypothetical protein Sya03_16550 [Spirilliplanes yamanashiensis]|uniref:Uncharacterized protein n=1 Tax=Spirilliplanes yamanashiensis TaxID=42233 RepID=A0A8J3Y6P4_9ACTN|nr:hypothetical protein Sya03_16550 [Spirilliplanes yamanashiensis]
MFAGAALAVAVGGGVLWAYGLAVWQPVTEASGFAENDTYWARDVRWAAATAAVGALLALTRGDRRVLYGAGAWLAADLVLDRAGVTPWPVLALIPAVLLLRPYRANRLVLTTAAAVCAATAPVAAMVESPTDTEAALVPSRLAAAVLLVLAAVGCALAAAPSRATARLGVAAVVGVVAAGAVAAFAASSGELLPGALIGGGLVAAVWALTGPWPGWPRLLGVLGAVLVGYPLLVSVAAFAQIFVPVAALFTALAGSPAVNSADSDVLYVAVGIVPGLVFAVAAAVGRRLDDVVPAGPGAQPHAA